MDPMTMAMLVQGGSSLLGGFLGSRRARKAKRKATQRLSRAIKTTRSMMGKGFDQQEALSRLGTQQQLGGVDAALREFDRAGRQSSRQAVERGTQIAEAGKQRMTDMGLDAATPAEGLQRAVGYDTSRQIADINEGLAGGRGQLQMGRAGIEAGGTADLASLAAQRAQFMSSLGQMELLGGQQLGQFDIGPWSTPNALEGSLGALSGGLGDFFGQKQEQDQQNQLLAQIFGMYGMGMGGMGGGMMGRRPPTGMNLNTFVR